MLTSAQQAEASGALQPLYTAAGGGNSAIPWADLIAILLPIIQGCLKPKTAADVHAAADSPMLRPSVRSACFEYGGFGWYRRHNGDAISEAFKGYLPTASDEILASVID